MEEVLADDEETFVEKLTKLIALLAALGGAVYVLGGVVMFLRLKRLQAPAFSAILGQLPREFLVTTAITAVLVPSAIAGVIYAFIRTVAGSNMKLPKHLLVAEDSGVRARLMHQWLPAAAAAVILTIVGVWLPLFHRFADLRMSHGLVQSWFLAIWRTVSWAVVGLVAEWAVLTTVLIARSRVVHDHRRSWGSRTAVGLMTLLVSVALVPTFLLFSSGIRLPKAEVCPVGGAAPEVGYLIGETSDRTYLIENEDGDDSPNRIASFPQTGIGELFIGKQGAICDSVAAAPSQALP
jgi:hypothetical protein